MPAKPLAVPSDHGIGLHHDQGGAPVLPTLGEEDPKQSVRRAELRTFHRSRQHDQLLTEREISSTIARCPPQISPIDRRSTISAVSMPDPLVDLTRESTGDMGAHVLASDRGRNITF
jgi:hypothetical protein